MFQHWLCAGGHDSKGNTVDLSDPSPSISLQVLLDSNGDAVDLVTVLLADSHVLLLASPGRGPAVLAWIAQQAATAATEEGAVGAGGNVKAEEGLKVSATDVSARCVMLSLVGPEAEAVLQELAGGVRGSRSCREGGGAAELQEG